MNKQDLIKDILNCLNSINVESSYNRCLKNCRFILNDKSASVFELLIVIELLSRMTSMYDENDEAINIIDKVVMDKNFWSKYQGESLSVNQLCNIIELINIDTIFYVTDKLKVDYSTFPLKRKNEVFEKLSKMIPNIDIYSLMKCLSKEDYQIGVDFCHHYMQSSNISFYEKYSLLEEMINLNIDSKTLDFFINDLIAISKEILTDRFSNESVVNQVVQFLREIIEKCPQIESTQEILEELYINNEYWKDAQKKRLEYRHKVLMNSFSAKVGNAFRKKDYSTVVRILKAYENELPNTLKKKYQYSLKMMV